ncbi:hypothetical protein [Actinomadura rupiterrae]|uniref:hypothetical protein n=1 Tax=Actinomadura rupiterrae TaxID=559627 RepID=UPI0020A52C27|nr:hypothetical protein [Actinomadura rupiterrae]MCP2334691.1 hypothetical protein [Actinomadura rupiterrae]
MSSAPVRAATFAELGALSAEALPPRTLLSVVTQSPRLPRTEVFYACQHTWSSGTPGILNTGLLAEPARSTTTCIPAVIVTH